MTTIFLTNQYGEPADFIQIANIPDLCNRRSLMVNRDIRALHFFSLQCGTAIETWTELGDPVWYYGATHPFRTAFSKWSLFNVLVMYSKCLQRGIQITTLWLQYGPHLFSFFELVQFVVKFVHCLRLRPRIGIGPGGPCFVMRANEKALEFAPTQH